jgi:hypothetical protein
MVNVAVIIFRGGICQKFFLIDLGSGDGALIDAESAMHQLSDRGRVARVGFPILSRNAQ